MPTGGAQPPKFDGGAQPVVGVRRRHPHIHHRHVRHLLVDDGQ